jgi:hypothetical protein
LLGIFDERQKGNWVIHWKVLVLGLLVLAALAEWMACAVSVDDCRGVLMDDVELTVDNAA